ncbi:translocation/assembly module TamB domain-containing protein [Lewinella sp. W8]|uniref:translocation/assembly module TamB domain-containing protein n=1 Tax=Lewinella sp. W8 TaxID=2528208 RepID=UPI001563BAA7|nr:translocation/assembly module TamB domain-containing protein [Lewinella sp. W8]
MTKRNILKKALKWIGWFITGLATLLVVLFLVVQLPFVQQWITGKVENIARKQLDTDLGIGEIRWKFPSEVSVRDVYLNNPAGDSIARLEYLRVGLNMFALLEKEVLITEVTAREVFADIRMGDSLGNIGFLLEMGSQSATPAAATDTSTVTPWSILASNAKLDLAAVDIFYQDEATGTTLSTIAERLVGRVDELDLGQQKYLLDYAELSGASVNLSLFPQGPTVPDTTESSPTPIDLAAEDITITESDFTLRMDSLGLALGLPLAHLDNGTLTTEGLLDFRAAGFELREASVRLDMPAPPIAGPGMDYNHLDVSAINVTTGDLAYLGDSLHLRLRQLTANERSGLQIRETEGTLTYTPEFLGLEEFTLQTGASSIRSDNTAINYDFAGGSPEDLIARLQLDGYLGLNDIYLLAPEIGREPVIAGNRSRKLDFSVRARGSLADMAISRIQLRGPGVRVNGSGQVQLPPDQRNISGRFFLNELSVLPGPLLPLIPEGMLPGGIDWPERIVAEGRAEYRNDRLQLNLFAVENRSFGNGMQSRVRTNGVVDGLQSYPRTSLDVNLDTLLATRSTLLAYLPPGTLPEDYRIPDFVRGSGTVTGPLDSLDVNLRLSLPGEETYATIRGQISNVLEPDNLRLDVDVSDLAINVSDIRSILPDSLLPDNLNLPNLSIRNASISGTPNNLTFDVPLSTTNGQWTIRGRYNPSDLDVKVDVKDLNLPELFTGQYRDTLETLRLGRLDIAAEVRGQLTPENQLAVAASISEAGRGEIMDLTATINGSDYAGEFNLTHPAFLAEGRGNYRIGPDSVVLAEAELNMRRVDLQRWDITEADLLLEGRLTARTVGLDPYSTEALVRFEDVFLRGPAGSSYVDSLVVEASLQDLDNEIYVRSDVLDAELLGRFDPVKTPAKMVQFIRAYWEEDLRQPVPVEDGERLDFTLQLKRPQPLTGGLIDGLVALSPMQASLLYRDASPELLMNLDLPEINYAGLEARGLAFRAVGDPEQLTWEADWADISYAEQVELGRTQLSGETVDDQLLVELKLYSEEDSLRHYLGLLADPEMDTIRLALEPEQLLNFEPWAVPVDNEILIAGDQLIVRNFALRNGEQSLEANSLEPGDVTVRFSDFELRTLSRIVFSEEEVARGVVNGEAELDNVLTNFGLQGDLRVDNLGWMGTKIGDLRAEVGSADEQTYLLDVSLTDAGNRLTLDGSYALDGPMDLDLNIEKLQLASAVPFSLGYLVDPTGYLTGSLQLGGTIASPTFDGSASFREASLIISLLGERFRLGEDPIRFQNKTVNFGDNWLIYDSRGAEAQVQGNVRVQSLDRILLDLRVVANDFLAINSTEEDNEDYYGYMPVDAEVDIGGTATLPRITVDASAKENSRITYVYRIPEEGLVESEGVVAFIEQYRWRDVNRRDTLNQDTVGLQRTGIDLVLNLSVTPDLLVNVIVDPISKQQFTGRATGDLTIRVYPDGRQEAAGRVVLTEGYYDFIYQNIINKRFQVLAGSSASFNGPLINPQLDLNIRYLSRTSPLPLVQGVLGESATVAGLRRRQTFYVDVGLNGDLQSSNITTNVSYPEDAEGNLGLDVVSDALGTLRQDESRMTTTAFQLLAFNSFNVPLLEQGAGQESLVNTTLDQLMGNYLNSFADQLIGFVELDFGVDSYQNENTGTTERNLRVSLRKSLFDDRVIISVDGVAGTAEDELSGTNQTYLDNITAEYLINEDGSFRLKFFNDRDRDILVGGNVVRFGGRLTFGKDFDRLGWSRKKDQEKEKE